MHELTIEELRILYTNGHVTWTTHTLRRMSEKHISEEDIEKCILQGEIIEQYPEDYPNPSCLILGLDIAGVKLHVVVGSSGEHVWVITAYRPDESRWENDYKTRKKVQK